MLYQMMITSDDPNRYLPNTWTFHRSPFKTVWETALALAEEEKVKVVGIVDEHGVEIPRSEVVSTYVIEVMQVVGNNERGGYRAAMRTNNHKAIGPTVVRKTEDDAVQALLEIVISKIEERRNR